MSDNQSIEIACLQEPEAGIQFCDATDSSVAALQSEAAGDAGEQNQDSRPVDLIQNPAITTQGKPRVYIKNLAYTTTEEELEELFRDYNLVSVIIPTYTVRGFRSPRYRPLGVAYAELRTHFEVDELIAKYNGVDFNGRKIVVKRYHVVNAKKEVTKHAPPVETPEGKPSDETPDPIGLQFLPSPYSNNTIFINKVGHKTTIDDIKQLFGQYDVDPIYLYEQKAHNRGRRRLSMSGRPRSALVTVNSVSLVLDVIDELQGCKLGGKPVVLRQALQSKVDEVLRAANSTVVE